MDVEITRALEHTEVYIRHFPIEAFRLTVEYKGREPWRAYIELMHYIGDDTNHPSHRFVNSLEAKPMAFFS